ncbi:hypothetical protein D3H65_24420 [Paraflavitalea soli]|uniref:Uncharacterized protein n=1 Tax=Paraflavitalea soli TaxID=2315862 RepID=A0A3B7MUM5_9BACT|nr:hypothetical protein [Paraflavitalea soli]AXY76939.1 hypothetical protein D3H65_24420 [Paraflavitalea soli]
MRQILVKISLLFLLAACCNSALAAPDNIRVDTSDANESLKDLQSVIDNNAVYVEVLYYRDYVDSSGNLVKDSSLISWFNAFKNNFQWTSARVYPKPFDPDDPWAYPIYKTEEHIQNDREYITFDDSSKTIVINKRISIMQAFFQLDLLDPQFVQDNVERMYAVDSLGFKVIKASFKPESPYLFYSLSYDTASLNPRKVSCVRKLENGSGVAAYDKVEIIFREYYLNGPIPTFLTNRYYTRVNSVYVLQPSYANFEILDLSAY